MNFLGLFLQVVCSVLLTFAPGAILKKDRLNISRVLTFLAILATCKVGGLLLAVPLTAILWLYFRWVRFVGYATVGTKFVLFWTTLILMGVYLELQIIHLPIRGILGQDRLRIEANVAGILVALCMFCALLELKMSIRRRLNSNTEEDVLDHAVFDIPLVESVNAGTFTPSIRREVAEEECPYCERNVQLDLEGRCPACNRPVA